MGGHYLVNNFLSQLDYAPCGFVAVKQTGGCLFTQSHMAPPYLVI